MFLPSGFPSTNFQLCVAPKQALVFLPRRRCSSQQQEQLQLPHHLLPLFPVLAQLIVQEGTAFLQSNLISLVYHLDSLVES